MTTHAQRIKDTVRSDTRISGKVDKKEVEKGVDMFNVLTTGPALRMEVTARAMRRDRLLFEYSRGITKFICHKCDIPFIVYVRDSKHVCPNCSKVHIIDII